MQRIQMAPTQTHNKIHSTHHMGLHMVKMLIEHMINMEQTQSKIGKWATSKQFIQHNIQESDHRFLIWVKSTVEGLESKWTVQKT